MKNWVQLFIGFVGIASTFLGSQPRNGAVKPVLEALVLKEYYCVGQPGGSGVPERLPPDAITLRLRVQLSYRNPSPRPMILPLLTGLTGLVLSPANRDNLQSQPQLIVPYFGRMTPEYLDFEGDEPTLKHHFEVIPPGGSSKWFSQPGTDQYVVLDVYNTASKFQKADLRGKKVFLQLELNHLRFPKSQADELSVRWARYGYLWTGKVKSSPIEISIPKSPEISDCSHEYRID